MKRVTKRPNWPELPLGDGPWTLTSHHMVGADKVELRLDEEFCVEVDAEGYYQRNWPDGISLSREQLAELVEVEVVKWCKNKVLNLLSYRPRTQSEIRSYLLNFDIDINTVNLVVSWLGQQGLVDDGKFIEMWVESRVASNPMGERRLAAELIQKGIDKSLVESKLSELRDTLDETSLAKTLAIKQARKYSREEPVARKRKLMGFLQRRGFSYDVIRTAVETVLDEDR